MISKETVKIVTDFRDKRQWGQFHNPKDLAISINLEASELLEIFQWSADELECADKTDKIREELADVLCYCILMADRCGLDMDEIIREKMNKNAKKYPEELARGRKEKYTELKVGSKEN
jgi:NTP pyrophosphatase (non-canonical NTP hydrolase)